MTGERAAPPVPGRRPRVFERFPALAERVPWRDLGLAGTPVERMRGLGAALGHDGLWIKRDDLTSPRYGGNKSRKLEFVLAEALARGSREVIAVGALGSHQCVATAAFAVPLGLGCVAAVADQPLTDEVRQNLLLDLHFGATFLYARDYDALARRVVERVREGRGSLVLAPGASTPAGNLGFVEAALELAEQVARGEMPAPDRIFVCGASTGSAAGLALGLGVAGLGAVVHVVAASEPRWCTPQVLAGHDRDLRDWLCGAGVDPGPPAATPRVHFDAGQLGRGYALATPASRRARALLARHEGIAVEPCYTAKTLAALCDYVAERAPHTRRETLLFWHTASSRDFRRELAACDPAALPAELHWVFES